MSSSSLLIYLAVGLVGGAAHWYKKWAEGSTKDTFTVYLLSNKKYTVSSLIGIISLAGGAAASGEPSITNCFYLFLSCLAADSVLNRGSTYNPETAKYPTPPPAPVKPVPALSPNAIRKQQEIDSEMRRIKDKIEHDDIQDIIDADSKL